MEKTAIKIQKTNNPTIIKFEADRFLTDHETFEYHNIDEAKNSQLAQQLFYLPFVKKVYISGNFIALERYDIVQWEDVQEEVAEQIEAFLNSGSAVVKKDDTKKKLPVTVYVESTPNPTTMKFIANKNLVTSTHEFISIDEAKNSPLATELFHLPFVKSVFIDENFISITKYDVAEWDAISMQLREFIRQYLENGKEVVIEQASTTSSRNSVGPTAKVEHEGIALEIANILEEYVKPAVARDGGNIEFVSYDPESKHVKVLLQGACSGCPSSTYTLKNGIENMLKELLKDKVETVDAING